MHPNIKKHTLEYAAIFLLAVFSGLLVSFYNLSVLFIIASILFVAASFKYFNQVLYLLILYIPFQIALNITSGIDLASGRVLILYLFAVWIIKSLAEKKFVIRLNSQTLLILLFLSIACFSILGAWDTERAFRKILVFLSVFPLYFVITSIYKGDIPMRRLSRWLHSSRLGTVEPFCKFALKLHSPAGLWSQRVSPIEPEMQDLKNNPPRRSLSSEDCDEKARDSLESSDERLQRSVGKILNMLLISGFILSLIGIIQFILQFIIGIDPVMDFWSEVIAPIFYGNTFGAEVVSNPSWLVNIGGTTVLRAVSLFPDPHMFSFYLGLLIPIALAIVICPIDKGGWGVKNQNYTKRHPELVSGSSADKSLINLQFIIQIAKRISNVCDYKQKILKQVQDDRTNSFAPRQSLSSEDSDEKAGNAIFLAGVPRRRLQRGESEKALNKSIYFILAAMLLAELLTFSRGGYLGLIAGIGAVIILSWRYISFNKKIILGFFAGIFVLFMIFGNQSIVNRFLSSFNPSEGSNTERIKNWSQGWEVFSDNALTGVGIGNYSVYLYPTADYRTPIYAHNLYLDIGAEMGVFALIVWLALIIITIYQLFRLSRNAGDNFTRSISLGLIGSLIWFSVHSFFDTAIYSPTVLAIFVIILSLAAMILEDKTQK